MPDPQHPHDAQSAAPQPAGPQTDPKPQAGTNTAPVGAGNVDIQVDPAALDQPAPTGTSAAHDTLAAADTPAAADPAGALTTDEAAQRDDLPVQPGNS